MKDVLIVKVGKACNNLWQGKKMNKLGWNLYKGNWLDVSFHCYASLANAEMRIFKPRFAKLK